MSKWSIRGGSVLALVMVAAAAATADTVTVNTVDALRTAITGAPAGAPRTVLVMPGTYSQRLWVSGARRDANSVITVRAQDPANRPVFNAHADSNFTLYDSSYIIVDGIIGQEAGTATTGGNGLEFTNSDHMILMNSISRNLINQGNSDAIKFATTSDILAYNNTVSNWAAGGSGFDTMNNHNSLFARNYITNTIGGSNGFQPKSNDAYQVGFYKNKFVDGGARSTQFGGSSGATGWEGREMVAMGNTIDTGEAAVAFVSCTTSEFAYNTIKNPETYIMRILNENTGPGSAYWTAYNTFRRNLIQYGNVTVQNIGSSTRAETFTYAEDYWYKTTNPAGSIPVLAAPESNPVGGTNPNLDGDYRPLLAAARNYGAAAPAMEAAFAAYTGWFTWAWAKLQDYEPDARAGGTYYVGPGGKVVFDGSASYGGKSTRMTYAIGAYDWDLNDDNVFNDGSGAALTRTYADLTGLGLGNGPHNVQLRTAVTTEYGDTLKDWGSATLLVTSLPGDTDCDFDVDFQDYQHLETAFGRTSGQTWFDGDLDADGDVDFADYQVLEAQFGRHVPEPAALALLALGLPLLRPKR